MRPKLRKFLSPDKAKQQYGTYTYVANNPVSFADRDGNWFDIILSEEKPEFKKATERMIRYLLDNGTPESRNTMKNLAYSSQKIAVVYGSKTNLVLSLMGETYADRVTRTLFFNPFMERLTYPPELGYFCYRSPLVSLLYEAIHAKNSFDIKTYMTYVTDMEQSLRGHSYSKLLSKEEYNANLEANKLAIFFQENTDMKELVNFLYGVKRQKREWKFLVRRPGKMVTQQLKDKEGRGEFLLALEEQLEDRLEEKKVLYFLKSFSKERLYPEKPKVLLTLRIENQKEIYLPRIKAIQLQKAPVSKETEEGDLRCKIEDLVCRIF